MSWARCSPVLPLAWPGLTTIALVSGLGAYNGFLLAVTFIQDRTKMPLATAFFSFQQGYTQDYTLISAAGIIMVLPPVTRAMVLTAVSMGSSLLGFVDVPTPLLWQ